MKICQRHWDMLRAAIDARGLSHLVARSGEEAIQRLARADGTSDILDYDPLMVCNWMIMNQGLHSGGPYLLTADLCPICESFKVWVDAENTEADIERWWIEGPADAALLHCQLNGLAPLGGGDVQTSRRSGLSTS